MIIDANTYLGHWPFREIKYNTADGLLNFMNKAGVDKAVVSSTNSIFYKDVQRGNLELAKEIKEHKDRFIPFAIINPAYPGWKKDYYYCLECLEMKGIELYPYYHNYHLTDANAIELMNLAAEAKIPVHLPCAVENIRQRHWLDTTANLSLEDMEKVMSLCPDVDFIISNAPSLYFPKRLIDVTSMRKGRVYYDFTRVDVFTSELEQLIEIAGIDYVAFGSLAPFQYIEPQLVKLHYLKLDMNKKSKIIHENIKNLLNL